MFCVVPGDSAVGDPAGGAGAGPEQPRSGQQPALLRGHHSQHGVLRRGGQQRAVPQPRPGGVWRRARCGAELGEGHTAGHDARHAEGQRWLGARPGEDPQ